METETSISSLQETLLAIFGTGMVYFSLRAMGKGGGSWLRTAGYRTADYRGSTASHSQTSTVMDILRSLFLADRMEASQSGSDASGGLLRVAMRRWSLASTVRRHLPLEV